MVSTNDPVESFLNSIQVVKDALLPLELGIKRAAKDVEKDVENCWGVSKSSGELNQVELNNKGDHNNKVQVCAVKKNHECLGLPSNLAGVSPSSADEEGGNGADTDSSEETGGRLPQRVTSGILNISQPNVEIHFIYYHPDKKKLFSVQDFFRYTEAEGRKFFEELDRDGDGQVTLEDLEIAVKKRKLPYKYARDFMRRAKSHLFSKSFGWKQFLSLTEQREPIILLLASLKNAGLPANEDNVVAMMRFLKADTEESISYGHFRNFMLSLPADRLQDDPRSICFEAATVVAVPPPVEIPAGSVLRSALAGGFSCALSCAVMHPVDTLKCRNHKSARMEIKSKCSVNQDTIYRKKKFLILNIFSTFEMCYIMGFMRLIVVDIRSTTTSQPCEEPLNNRIRSIIWYYQPWYFILIRYLSHRLPDLTNTRKS
ncbi:hypothetical protein K2173_014409 [Erythroxylum novogranatense]|uniref:EF-hand domain-containing protein n=1 Tax=Erythroxylum novogranatense TaxID=1862640 RepID=A0AAV8S5D7_9ROSI|nr:hypothetical protein K2173_014409 [Erythroxylum novogranatense]